MKIMIVDDNPELVELLELQVLSNFKAKICKAYGGEEALAAFNSDDEIDILISDLRMPKMNGDTLYQEVRKLKMHLPFVMVSANLEEYQKKYSSDPFFKTMDKPFDEEKFCRLIDELVKSKNSKALVDHKGLKEVIFVEHKNPAFVPLDIQFLSQLRSRSVPLYIKLSENKFVKVFHESTVFTVEDMKK